MQFSDAIKRFYVLYRHHEQNVDEAENPAQMTLDEVGDKVRATFRYRGNLMYTLEIHNTEQDLAKFGALLLNELDEPDSA